MANQRVEKRIRTLEKVVEEVRSEMQSFKGAMGDIAQQLAQIARAQDEIAKTAVKMQEKIEAHPTDNGSGGSDPQTGEDNGDSPASSDPSIPKLMKIRGTILGRPVVAVVVTGCYYNFISEELVADLGVAISKTKPYGLDFGLGVSKLSQGVCKGVELKFDELDVVEDFLPTQLGNADVILAMKWMKTLGPFSMDFEELKMEFKMGERSVCLRGDPSLTVRHELNSIHVVGI